MQYHTNRSTYLSVIHKHIKQQTMQQYVCILQLMPHSWHCISRRNVIKFNMKLKEVMQYKSSCRYVVSILQKDQILFAFYTYLLNFSLHLNLLSFHIIMPTLHRIVKNTLKLLQQDRKAFIVCFTILRALGIIELQKLHVCS